MFTPILFTAALAAVMGLPGVASAAAGPVAADPQQVATTVGGSIPAGRGRRPERRKDALLVKLKADASPAQTRALTQLYEKYGLRMERRLLDGAVGRLHVSNKAFEDREETIAAQIMGTGAAEISEPDYFVPLALVPADPLYPQQWHHPRINSPAAWDISQGSATVLVAVCDAGFYLSHADLVDRYVLPGYNTVFDNSEIDDVNDHGTMTSGTLAATANNGRGVAGMAWQVRLLPIQVSNREDGVSTYSEIAECIAYAQGRGARVANISYGNLYTSATIDEAALNFRNAGGLVVVSAGNDGSDISAWGDSDVLIVAGATDASDSRSWFSNFGTPVDLYAPGEGIYTTIAGDAYGFLGGTSFSAPLVSGTIALMYSLRPQWTPAQVEHFLLSSVTQVGGLGRLNAGAALQRAVASLAQPIEMDNLAANVSDASRISTGKWCVSNDSGFYGARSLASCGPKRDAYRFVPTITATGAYTVSLRYVARKRLSKKATVIIKDATGRLTRTINMRVNGGAWASLGTFTLAAGTSSYLEVNDGSGAVNIDGARFEVAR